MEFVDVRERVYANYIQQSDAYKFEVVVTDRRVYTNSGESGKSQENIADLNSVDYVNYVHTVERKNVAFLVAVGVIMLAAVILMAILGSGNRDMIIAGLIILFMGMFVVGLAIGRPTDVCKLIISTSGNPIELTVRNIDPRQIKDIQKNIFMAKDSHRCGDDQFDLKEYASAAIGAVGNVKNA